MENILLCKVLLKAVPNYKGFFSIVLLTACDANYTFTDVDISSYGSNNDSSVLKSSRFGEAIEAGNLVSLILRL